MSNYYRTPKSVTITLAAGIAIGAISMAGVSKGIGVSKAQAQTPRVSVTSRHISSISEENLEALHSLDTSMANLAEFVAPAVVHITSVNERSVGPNGERRPIAGGQGSGFIFRPDGWIITNDHVVGGFEKVTVILKDGREYKGTVRRAEDSDIALIKIDANDLPTLAFSDSDQVRPGQISMAIGAPFGLEQSVTIGHISALGRINQIQDKLYPDLIQTDTSINMGNSGGPLVNVDGQVIGINTAIFSPTGVSSGIGFAIPANQARMIADILITEGKLTRSMMKLVPENLKDYQKKEMGLEGGALVAEVQSDGPAAAAGIVKGDVIVKIGDTEIKDQLDLRNAMLKYRPGTTVPVELIRNKQREKVNVKLIAFEAPKVSTSRPRMPGGEGPNSPEMPFPHEFEDLRDWFKDSPQFDRDRRPQEKIEDVPPISDRPKLGVNVDGLSDANRKQFRIPSNVQGALVTGVVPGSYAERIGIKTGDVITEFGGKKLRNEEDLIEAVREIKLGDKRKVAFVRYSDGGMMSMAQDVVFK